MSKIVIAFLLTFSGGILATLLIDVSWGVYLYQIEYFLNPRVRWWYGSLPQIRYTFVIAICILLAFLMQSNKYSKNSVFDLPQAKWFLLNWFLFAVISLWAVWPEMHQKSLVAHSKLIVLMFVAYKVIDSREKIEKLIWTFLIGNFYVGWVAKNVGRNSMGRLEGIGPSDSGDANACSAILISAVPLLIYYLSKHEQWWKRIIIVLVLAYIMNAVVLINSRGAFLGIGVSSAYFTGYIFFTRTFTLKQRFQLLAILIAGICLFVYLTDATFWERMATLGGASSGEEGESGAGRIFFWQKAWELAKDHPFGVGTWGFQYLSAEFIPPEMLSGGRRAVHSTYFQCLAERGYLGTFVFMALLYSNFSLMRKTKLFLLKRRQIRLYQQGLFIEAGYIAFLTASIFINRLHAEILYWFMLIMCCFCNVNYLSEQQKQIKG